MALTQYDESGHQLGGVFVHTEMDVVIHSDQLDAQTVESVRSIYFDSFPAPERVDFPTLISDIETGQRHLFTVNDSGNVIAFAVTIPLPNTEFTLLEYIAVHNSMRSQGIGGSLLDSIVWNRRPEKGKKVLRGIILEVEAPEPASGEERIVREHRIQFYLRHGARPIECAPHYCIPNLETGIGTVPLNLLCIPVSGKQQELTRSTLEACIRGIYRLCYGRDDEDTILKKVLQDLNC